MKFARSSPLMVASMLLAAAASAEEFTPLGTSMIDAGFEQIAREHRVTVFKDEEADLIRLVAEGVIAVPPERVMAVLLDYEGQLGKMGRVTEARILARGEQRLLVYQRITLPVIDDRDFTIWVTWGQDGDVHWLRYRNDLNRGPVERDDVVRVPHHCGSWQLKPLRDGKATQARFQTAIDLGGLIPTWLARAVAGDDVPEVFTGLCRILGKETDTCLVER